MVVAPLESNVTKGEVTMTVLMGHFDGQCVILDGPVPRGMRANTPVKVLLETPATKRVGRIGTPANKLPSLASLKVQLSAGSDSSLAKAQANAMKLIGRQRI